MHPDRRSLLVRAVRRYSSDGRADCSSAQTTAPSGETGSVRRGSPLRSQVTFRDRGSICHRVGQVVLVTARIGGDAATKSRLIANFWVACSDANAFSICAGPTECDRPAVSGSGPPCRESPPGAIVGAVTGAVHGLRALVCRIEGRCSHPQDSRAGSGPSDRLGTLAGGFRRSS